MEKPGTRSKMKLWKAVQAAVTFQIRAGAIAHRHHAKGFSGPMIPAEARRREPKMSFENQEPTSPKVSCTGQIKHVKAYYYLPRDSKPEEKKQQQMGIKKKMMLFGAGRKSDASIDASGPTPGLIQMRRFSSNRDALAGFDWTAAAQIAPAEDREYCSGGERGRIDGGMTSLALSLYQLNTENRK